MFGMCLLKPRSPARAFLIGWNCEQFHPIRNRSGNALPTGRDRGRAVLRGDLLATLDGADALGSACGRNLEEEPEAKNARAGVAG